MPQLTDQKIAAIYHALANNKPVRYHGPEHGNIHIDRQLPFLVVYRRPADSIDIGTDRLLLGEASYLLVEDVAVNHEALSEIVTTIAKIQSEEKGEVTVPVIITDEANVEPIKANMTWAWTAKRK